MIIDVATVRSLADLFRREQSAGHCLDPDQAATTAVTHLMALGYRGPRPRPDLIVPAHSVPVSEPLPATPATTAPPSPSPSPVPHARDAAAPAASNSMERHELDLPGDPVATSLATSQAASTPAHRDRPVPTLRS